MNFASYLEIVEESQLIVQPEFHVQSLAYQLHLLLRIFTIDQTREGEGCFSMSLSRERGDTYAVRYFSRSLNFG